LEAKLAALIIYTSVREIVEHQQYVFDQALTQQAAELENQRSLAGRPVGGRMLEA
jgi:hypothetical protein